ncbi:MAG: aminoacyl-tRNA hydrolase [Candidatus Saccharimonadales bacterium]
MKLIIGLGNPEERYTNTRHNLGFRVLDAYGKKNGADFAPKEKFKAHVAELIVAGEKVILAKPTTYYNNAGECVRSLVDFYKPEADSILVVHDELALPFGTIRTRIGGSDAGNNGVKSITQHMGPDTARIRIGVYNDLRDRIDDADFVLSNFTKVETKALSDVTLPKAIQIIDDFVADNFAHTTHA